MNLSALRKNTVLDDLLQETQEELDKHCEDMHVILAIDERNYAKIKENIILKTKVPASFHYRFCVLFFV